ncbi:amino acid ABC transporter [Desulfonema ishimotonii]|uniref:Amino acid ABC transporter n=2 Tax=Desulfonema ishimotonii TaxID=45657 RepID=A0A401FZH2_9BACT|nr:amino acid ABC transporter [Desulfonema ishimotonii]
MINIFIMLIFFLPVCAAAEKVVFVSVEKDIPPNMYQEDGELKGIYIDIIRQACKKLDIDPDFRLYPWKRCVKYVKDGRAEAIFPPIRTEKRAEFLYFPSEPMADKKIVVFALKEDHIKIERLADLKGKLVGVNDGYSYGSEFDSFPGLKKDYSRNIDMQVKKLVHHRMDVAVAVEAPFRFFSKKSGFSRKVEVVYTVSEESSYVAFSKTMGEKGKLLSEKFGLILKQLKKEGVVRKIRDDYLK